MQHTDSSSFSGFNNLYPDQVYQSVLKGFWKTFPLTAFTTKDLQGNQLGAESSPIVEVKNSVNGLKSFSTKITKIYGGDYRKFRMNFEDRIGYAQQVVNVTDKLDFDYYSQVGSSQHSQWLAQGQNLLEGIPTWILDDLSKREAQHTENMFFKSIFDNLYKAGVNGSAPRSSRAVAGIRGSGVAGGAAYTYNVGQDLPTTLANGGANAINNAIHAPTLLHLNLARQRAKTKNYLGEIITPGVMETNKGYPAYKYFFFCGRNFYMRLCQDPQFIQQFLARGYVVGNQPNSVMGYDWKGEVDGIEIIVCDELDNYYNKAAYAGANVAWSFLMGGQAFAFGTSPLKGITRDIVAANDLVVTATHNVKAFKCLLFQAPETHSIVNPAYVPAAGENLLEENGLIHSFTYIN